MIRGAVNSLTTLTSVPCSSPPQFLLRRVTARLMHPSSFTTRHDLFVEMPQRDALHLLKSAPAPPQHVGRAHSFCLKSGSLSCLASRTSLLAAYAKAGLVSCSLALFNEALAWDVVLWNAIIHALVNDCNLEAAFSLFHRMTREFREIDSTTLVILLPALSRVGHLEGGLALHGCILKRGLDLDTSLCNSLIYFYAKCGELGSSQSVFEKMEFKDAVSWNSLVTGYHHGGLPKKSASCFMAMIQHSELRADHISLSSVISACSCSEEIYNFGESVHCFASKTGYETHPSVSNSLLSFYSRCRDVEAAEKIFNGLGAKNVVSCNAMLNLLVETDREAEAFDLLRMMLCELLIEPDSATLVTILPLCSQLALLREGKAIHGFVIRKEINQPNLSLTNSLIDMYTKCNGMRVSSYLFKVMTERDVISWNTVIAGYSRNEGFREESKALFVELLQTGLTCSLVTVLAILPSCNSHNDQFFGKLIHCWGIKCGFFSYISAVNALMLMYINCGDLVASFALFNGIMAISDIISWNTIIVGCTQRGHYRDALEVFKLMQQRSLSEPDSVTLVNVLSACGNLTLSHNGRAVHGLSLKSLRDSDLQVRNALITMYSRCGDTRAADLVFKTDGAKNLFSWNCMISGLVQNSEAEKALKYFYLMEKFRPNEITIVSILCACTQIKDLRHGMQINGYVFRFGFHRNTFISAALVDMYSKCGTLDTAIRVFRHSEDKSVASWNSMIFAYGYYGYGGKAIDLLSEMCKLGIEATKSTFIGILLACSHSGLIDEGLNYYSKMTSEFGIYATTEHHVCIVDMLGRSGRLSEAYEFIKSIKGRPSPSVWGALLSACDYHGDVEMGKSVAEHLFHLDPENEGYYVALSNLYCATERWGDAINVRSMIQDRGLVKPPGCSLIEVCAA